MHLRAAERRQSLVHAYVHASAGRIPGSQAGIPEGDCTGGPAWPARTCLVARDFEVDEVGDEVVPGDRGTWYSGSTRAHQLEIFLS